MFIKFLNEKETLMMHCLEVRYSYVHFRKGADGKLWRISERTITRKDGKTSAVSAHTCPTDTFDFYLERMGNPRMFGDLPSSVEVSEEGEGKEFTFGDVSVRVYKDGAVEIENFIVCEKSIAYIMNDTGKTIQTINV